MCIYECILIYKGNSLVKADELSYCLYYRPELCRKRMWIGIHTTRQGMTQAKPFLLNAILVCHCILTNIRARKAGVIQYYVYSSKMTLLLLNGIFFVCPWILTIFFLQPEISHWRRRQSRILKEKQLIVLLCRLLGNDAGNILFINIHARNSFIVRRCIAFWRILLQTGNNSLKTRAKPRLITPSRASIMFSVLTSTFQSTFPAIYLNFLRAAVFWWMILQPEVAVKAEIAEFDKITKSERYINFSMFSG